MKSGPAEAVVGTAGVLLKVQPMSDLGNPKDGVGVRRKPRKRYGVHSQTTILFLM